MYETEFQLIGLSLALAVGYYSIYYLVFEKPFIERFKQYKNAIRNELREAAKKFLSEFGKELDEGTDPEELIAFTEEWSAHNSVILEILNSWSSISSRHKYILGLAMGTILFTDLYIMNPTYIVNVEAPTPINFFNIAGLCFFW